MTTERNPFEPIEDVFESMTQQFEEAAEAWESGESYEYFQPGFKTMAADVVERDDEYVVTVDVPGFEREGVDVELTDRKLTIEAERDLEEETKEEEGEYIRRERQYRKMSRTIRLHEAVEPDEASATMDSGVLTITVPRAEPERPGHEIEVTSA